MGDVFFLVENGRKGQGLRAIRDWRGKGGPEMTEEFSFALPIKRGKLEEAGRFCEEMATGDRAEGWDRSRRRMGARKVKVWIQHIGVGSRAVLIAYWEVEDTERLVRELAESQDPFDVWFREGVLELHGVDLSQGPLRAPPAKVIDWRAG